MTNYRALPIVSLLATALLLSACAGPRDAADDVAGGATSPAPTASATPTETPSPTPTPEPSAPTGDDYDALCTALLDEETTSAWEADGIVYSEDFDERVSDQGSPIFDFVEFGGVACQWGYPNSDVSINYGYGPISDEDSAATQAELEAEAINFGPNENGGTFYEVDQGGNSSEDEPGQVWVFSPEGYWAMSQDNGLGNVIEEVVANAPAFY